ncbi:DUF5631 domain-containing protein [Mycobacterium vicinigordonae]|uniref:DUF5631 domain-containing protein n=1 Tax=Mycobacterium vicinigordonae TaxID=1719132 RepID=A0A7D6E502_9MYCO|nr:DUF5631 domain-containing protein [Mycobacterium vicinigordonae]QLL07502.1 DUF5631 domain-containing protein [Mycobacterium vicinigordonae]
MGIFGRVTARQRLRRATAESLTVPTFSGPPDCTPWVIGELWPAELSRTSPETASLATYLKADLQRIADTANVDLRSMGHAGMTFAERRAAEARLIGEARALAQRRVESTLRQLRGVSGHAFTDRQPSGEAGHTDIDKTQVIPAVRDEPADEIDTASTRVLPSVRDRPVPSAPAQPEAPPQAPESAEADRVTDHEHRLHALLAYVARQEPRLGWAVGERADGTTVLVTDLAHGWIPPGIAVPEGVRLLEPDRRTGRAAELLGTTTRALTYAPGDPSKLSSDVPATPESLQPFQLPPVDDLGWELGAATHWRDGLPRLVNTLAKAAAAGTDLVDQEVDLLRVHLDTARYQLLAHYPEPDPAQLLNCMLLAATERSVAGDTISANYHFAWFRKLTGPKSGEQAER